MDLIFLKPLKQEYKHEDELAEEYCIRLGCNECEGTDQNGETNGYACELMEKFVNDNYHLIVDDE